VLSLFWVRSLICFCLNSEEESDEDEEDDTAELLRELEKIKRERAEEKARLENEQSAKASASRDAEIATANPLLNLAAALGQAPGVNTTVPGTFQVKKRWDDGRNMQLFDVTLILMAGSRSNFQKPGNGPKIWPRQFCQRLATNRVP
jgi:hypothetical protein